MPTSNSNSLSITTRCYPALLLLLSVLFFLRVLGQAIQRWLPQTFLPPFDAFQGSNLPYWLLLSLQVMILTVMIFLTWKVYCRVLIPRANVGKALLWIGCIYMGGSILRIIVGLTVPNAPAWFSTWIPAVFHVVLAAFTLTLASFHLRESRMFEKVK